LLKHAHFSFLGVPLLLVAVLPDGYALCMRNYPVAVRTIDHRRALLADLIGAETVEALSERAVGRVLGAVFSTARREVERVSHPGQLGFDDEPDAA